jgi:zinc transporter, ZIP family
MSSFLNVLLIGFLAGATTTIGGILAVLFKPREVVLIAGLGFSSGVMLGITFLLLIPKALTAGFGVCFGGFLVGTLFMFFFDMLLPHRHILQDEEGLSDDALSLRKVGVMAAIGIAIHDFPEGLALGAGFGVLKTFGFVLALGIALHNIPEGIAISLPLYHSGLSRTKSALAAAATDVPTIIGAVLAYFLGQVFTGNFMFALLAFAGGAMFYITMDELVPEAHKFGRGFYVTAGIIAGIMTAFLLTRLG